MIIKDLIIVSNEGRTYYHYRSQSSNYNIDNNLFSGFVAALSVFTTSLSDQKKIEFLKLQEDEMYFTILDNIIVASIMSVTGFEQRVVDHLLKFLGKKFLDKYYVNLNKPSFNWESIADNFTQEIESVWSTTEIYEKTKRDLIAEFVAQTLEGELSTELLQWKITSLFLNSSPDEIEKTLNKVFSLRENLNNLTGDPIMRAGLSEAFDNIIADLSKVLPKKSASLLVISDNREIFELLYRKSLGYHIFCIPVANIYDLTNIVAYWKGETPYSIALINHKVTQEEFDYLRELDSKGKIFIWVNTISPEIENQAQELPKIKIFRQLPAFNDIFNKIIREANLIEAT